MIHEIKLLNMKICKYLPYKNYNRACIAIHNEILKHSTINVCNHFYYVFFAVIIKTTIIMMIKDI